MGAPREIRNPALKGLRLWPVKDFEELLIFYLVAGDTLYGTPKRKKPRPAWRRCCWKALGVSCHAVYHVYELFSIDKNLLGRSILLSSMQGRRSG